MKAFAQNTKVPVERSQAEIEKMLKAHGATKFGRGDDGSFEAVTCHLNERLLMFELPFETKSDAKRRAKWRALVLTIKAKFVSVDAGVENFDEAFLAQIVVPSDDGRAQRVGRIAQSQIAEAYKKGSIPNFGAAGLLESGRPKP